MLRTETNVTFLGYVSFVSMLLVDLYHNHPVVKAFVELLLKVREQEQPFTGIDQLNVNSILDGENSITDFDTSPAYKAYDPNKIVRKRLGWFSGVSDLENNLVKSL